VGRPEEAMTSDSRSEKAVLDRSIKMVDLAISDIRNLAPKTAIGRLEQVLEMLESLAECNRR
jgi:hypothetical protein